MALGEVKYTQGEPRYRDRYANDPEIGRDVHYLVMMSFGAYLWQSRCIGGTNSGTRVRGPFFLSLTASKMREEIEKDLKGNLAAIQAHQDWSHALAQDIRSQWPPFTVRISFIGQTRKGGEKSS
jgi:hypothetical protein